MALDTADHKLYFVETPPDSFIVRSSIDGELDPNFSSFFEQIGFNAETISGFTLEHQTQKMYWILIEDSESGFFSSS